MKLNYDRMVADMINSAPNSKSILAAVLVVLVVAGIGIYSIL